MNYTSLGQRPRLRIKPSIPQALKGRNIFRPFRAYEFGKTTSQGVTLGYKYYGLSGRLIKNPLSLTRMLPGQAVSRGWNDKGNTMISHPLKLGYRFPAEWEPHEATWLTWPSNPETWSGLFSLIPNSYIDLIKVLHEDEKIHLIVQDQQAENHVTRLLTQANINLNQIFFFHFPTNDCWIRDYGPLFLVNHQKKQIAVTEWEFNRWGGKYPPWDLDNAIQQKIALKLKLPSFKSHLVLEGGSIDVNGRGTLITTESCLLNKNRNPRLNQSEIEACLKNFLDVNHILWLKEGIVGDDTDGHVDDITRFVNPSTVVTCLEENRTDENYRPLQSNLKRLQSMKDQDGQKLSIIPLPMPSRPIMFKGQRLPASYANFYIANSAVVVPTFNDSHDEKALSILKDCFPQRQIVGLNARNLVLGLGAFHCISQQQPKI